MRRKTPENDETRPKATDPAGSPAGSLPAVPKGSAFSVQQYQRLRILWSKVANFDVDSAIDHLDHFFEYRGPMAVDSPEMQRRRRAAAVEDGAIALLASKLRAKITAAPLSFSKLMYISQIDRDRLMAMLDLLSTDLQEKPRRGKPPIKWRDDLIALIFHMYPTGTAKMSDDGAGKLSNFEEAVRLVLKFAGATVPKSLHKQIIESRKRTPDAPFKILKH